MKDDDEAAHQIAKRIHRLTDSLSQGALDDLLKAGDRKPPDHLYVMISAACSAIGLAAKIMTMPNVKEDTPEAQEWSDTPPQRAAIVAAALLLARCMLPYKGGMRIEVTPVNIRAALVATEKVLGVLDRNMFSSSMLEVADARKTPDHFLDNTKVDLTGYGTLH